MTHHPPNHEQLTTRSKSVLEPDDIEAYVATLSDEERGELAAAEAAIDIAILLNRARRRRGLSQAAAAEMTGLKQQAISRFESPDANPRLSSIRAYLGALGFALELKAIDLETGDVAAVAFLPPTRYANHG
jgi:DNA-binding phage protein